MSSCPRCGGTSSRRITPNTVECTNEVLVGIANQPFGQQPAYQRCGQRYTDQAGPPVGGEACMCGQYAIGHCSVCKQPRCGDHAVVVGQRFVCPAHLRHEAGDRQVLADRQVASAADALSDWLASVEDPYWRLLSVVVHARIQRPPGAYYVGPTRVYWPATSVLVDAFPEWPSDGNRSYFAAFFGGELGDEPPVRREEATRWFRSALHAAGDRPLHRHTYTFERRTFWSSKRKTVQGRTVTGWRFDETFLLADDDESDECLGALHVGVLQELAQRLSAPAMPTDLLDAYNSASKRVYDLNTEPLMGDPVRDAILRGRKLNTETAP